MGSCDNIKYCIFEHIIEEKLHCQFYVLHSYIHLHTLWFHGFRVDGGRGSPKPDLDSRDLLEERVSTRGSAASPTGAHVADIYLANLNKCMSC